MARISKLSLVTEEKEKNTELLTEINAFHDFLLTC